MFGQDKNKNSHAMGKMGGDLGMGLPQSNPEKPLETKPFADMSSPSPGSKAEQHAMTDWENTEDKTPLGSVFGTPDAVDPLGGSDGQVRSTGEIAEKAVPFVKFQAGPGRESEKHMYADLTIAQAKDKAELAGKYNLFAQDSFTFGLPGRGKVNLSSKNQCSAKQGNAGNPSASSGNGLPSSEGRTALEQEGGGSNKGGRKQTSTLSDMVRLSPLAVNSSEPNAQDTTSRLGSKQQPRQGEPDQNSLERLHDVDRSAPIQATDNPNRPDHNGQTEEDIVRFRRHGSFDRELENTVISRGLQARDRAVEHGIEPENSLESALDPPIPNAHKTVEKKNGLTVSEHERLEQYKIQMDKFVEHIKKAIDNGEITGEEAKARLEDAKNLELTNVHWVPRAIREGFEYLKETFGFKGNTFAEKSKEYYNIKEKELNEILSPKDKKEREALNSVSEVLVNSRKIVHPPKK